MRVGALGLVPVVVIAGACGGSAERGAPVSTVTQTVTVGRQSDGGPDETAVARVERIKSLWCSKVRLGMTHAQLVARLGPPDFESAEQDGSTYGWGSFQWSFDAEYDTDGHVYKLTWSDQTGREELPCPFSRVVGRP